MAENLLSQRYKPKFTYIYKSLINTAKVTHCYCFEYAN